MTFLEVANSPFVYIVCGIAVLIVVGILLNFIRIALKRAKELNIDSKKIRTTVKTTILVSIGPAFSILIPLIVMIKLLGSPWSWLRLSVVGSGTMEMLLAENSMAAAGYEGLSASATLGANAFGMVALAVGIATSSGILINIIFNKRYASGIENAKQGNFGWISILLAAIFGGLMINFGAGAVVNDGSVAMAVFFTTLMIAFVVGLIIDRFKLTKLKEYSYAIILLTGMASAILWNNLLV